MPGCTPSFVLAVALAIAPSETPLQEEAKATWERADALAAEGDHNAAVVAYARAWQDLEALEILYSWAQSERLRGHCTEAAALYERFLAEGQTPPTSYATDRLRAQWSNMLANAERQRDACRADQPQRDPEPLPDPEPQRDPEPSSTARPPDPAPVVATPPKPLPSRRWQRDAAGWSLAGTGAAALVTGAVLVVVADRRDAGADRLDTHQSFDDAIDQAIVMQRAGFGMLAVGGALAVAGIVRFAVVARRSGARPRSAFARPGPGGSIRGRF